MRLKPFIPVSAVLLIAVVGTVVLNRIDTDPALAGLFFVLVVAAAGWFSGPIGHEIYLRQQRSRQG